MKALDKDKKSNTGKTILISHLFIIQKGVFDESDFFWKNKIFSAIVTTKKSLVYL